MNRKREAIAVVQEHLENPAAATLTTEEMAKEIVNDLEVHGVQFEPDWED